MPKRTRDHGTDGEAVNTLPVSALRQVLASAGVDAFIVPTDDPHQSEYVAPRYERRAFISGFTGSSGTAVITKDHALLWTDGRYFLQAQAELHEGWVLMKDRLPTTVPIDRWLATHLPANSLVAVDPCTIAYDLACQWKTSLAAAGLRFEPMETNPVDTVWSEAMPSMSGKAVFFRDETLSGATVARKLQDVDAALDEASADALVVSALDEIAWLLNVRGSDVDYCPVCYAYGIAIKGGAFTWYVDEGKVPEKVLEEVRTSAAGRAVHLAPYAAVHSGIKALVAEGKRLLVPSTSSLALHMAVTDEAQKVVQPSPVTLLKARKNTAEVAGMRHAHIKDARALCTFLAWLARGQPEDELPADLRAQAPTEVHLAKVLESFREQEDGYMGPSFETISAYGSNGAVIHYKPEESSCKLVGTDSFFLLDSGGQYLDGTTDVTRTVHLEPAKATRHQRECWTRVLKAHIACDSLIFPEGTTGYQLDAVARAPLWAAGLDYRHGTGHGVGAFLNVHEGPHGMSLTRLSTNEYCLDEGMTLSNEPGTEELPTAGEGCPPGAADALPGCRATGLLTVRLP